MLAKSWELLKVVCGDPIATDSGADEGHYETISDSIEGIGDHSGASGEPGQRSASPVFPARKGVLRRPGNGRVCCTGFEHYRQFGQHQLYRSHQRDLRADGP